MKVNTRKRKKARKGLREMYGAPIKTGEVQ